MVVLRKGGPAPDHGITRNGLLLLSVPLGVVTVTKPVVAPAGIAVVISVPETMVNAAAVEQVL